MAEAEKRTRWGVIAAVLAVPVALTVAGTVLIFSLPSHGYEAGEALLRFRAPNGCPGPFVDRVEFNYPASLTPDSCDHALTASADIALHHGDAAQRPAEHVLIFEHHGAASEEMLDSQIDALRRDLGVAEWAMISHETYGARGADLSRRDLACRFAQDGPIAAGDWVLRAVLVPRPHGEGGAILVGLRMQDEDGNALAELSRDLAPMIESLRF